MGCFQSCLITTKHNTYSYCSYCYEPLPCNHFQIQTNIEEVEFCFKTCKKTQYEVDCLSCKSKIRSDSSPIKCASCLRYVILGTRPQSDRDLFRTACSIVKPFYPKVPRTHCSICNKTGITAKPIYTCSECKDCGGSGFGEPYAFGDDAHTMITPSCRHCVNGKVSILSGNEQV